MSSALRPLLTLFVILSCWAPAVAFPINVAGLDTARTAIWIHDLRLRADLVRTNIDTSLVPASVMKSVTSAALLNLADPDERFVTHVYADGRLDADGTLSGNIIVRAVGDPTIESQFFNSTRGFADSIVAGVRRLGITAVGGKVMIDESDFPDATTPPGWMEEDLIWPYGTRLQGANFRDNRFHLRLPSCQTSPRVPDLKFNFKATKARGVSIDRKDGSETFTVTGNTRRAYSDNFATPYPCKVMAAEVTARLCDAGIPVNGADLPSSSEIQEIYTHLSPTFGEILRSLMHRSDNLMAEGMLRAIAPGGTRDEAIAEVLAVWNMVGISSHGVNIVDGSGLSRDDRLTARFLGEINRQMIGEEFGADYVSLFPRAGFDGTMKGFLAETPLQGRVAMKTGSMKGVQSYSGYLLDAEGQPTHLLVFIVNGFRCSRASLKNAIQRLLLDTFSVSLQDETHQ